MQLSYLLEVTEMTRKELQKMGRRELIVLLLEISNENDRLRTQLSDAQRRLASREIRIKRAGSIAEAAMELNHVFEAAQSAANQYLENIKRNTEGSIP